MTFATPAKEPYLKGIVIIDLFIKLNISMQQKKLIIPWPTQAFIDHWSLWKEYKKQEFRFSYKSVISEQAAINSLVSLSGGDESVARQIIDQSIANGWKGFFHLKNLNHASHSATVGKVGISARADEARRNY